jgi:hypothetical protein
MARLEDVFVTEGIPALTFIQPPNFSDIMLDVRRPGKPVIVEGQSGTGKTTCVAKIIEKLHGQIPVTYLRAREPKELERITALVSERPAGIFVVDDFHRLPKELQIALADLAKAAAEQTNDQSKLPKLVLIGINEVGSDLIQLVPDIAKRTGIHRIKPGTQQDVASLVARGSEALRVRIPNGDVIFAESNGDYWLTQQLCQSICALNNVLDTKDVIEDLSFDLVSVRSRVVDQLKAAFYPAVKEFCRGQRFRPSNDPYFKLLRVVGQQTASVVDLNELANANPEVRGSINNVKEHRLGDLLEEKPICARHFYYNQETKNFAIEDPALFYFLKHLDWNALRSDCGFRDAKKDYEWDFAISFAGENRELARAIANNLETLDARVFLDENYEANYLGRTWGDQFKRIFGQDSRLVICLLDVHHNKKVWPTFERDCFTPRVKDAEVIPIYLDDTAFVGIPSDTHGIMFKKRDWTENQIIAEIVFPLMERLN